MSKRATPKLALSAALALAASSVSLSARADLPVIIEYSAPPECASTEAFDALVRTQLAPHVRSWRFVVTVRRESDWVASIESSSATRELHAASCDDVVAAAALVIATAAPEAPREAPPPPEQPPPAPPPRAELAPLRIQGPEPDRVARSPNAPDWRLAARAQDWTNLAWLNAIGGSVAVSVEPKWGSYRATFELALDVLESDFGTPGEIFPRATLTWGILDFQACPLDLALGKTGLSILGCARVAGAVNRDSTAATTSGAVFFGGGGRLRWQTPTPLFLEAHANGVYGTQSSPLSGSPGWLDLGGTVGFLL